MVFDSFNNVDIEIIANKTIVTSLFICFTSQNSQNWHYSEMIFYFGLDSILYNVINVHFHIFKVVGVNLHFHFCMMGSVFFLHCVCQTIELAKWYVLFGLTRCLMMWYCGIFLSGWQRRYKIADNKHQHHPYYFEHKYCILRE